MDYEIPKFIKWAGGKVQLLEKIDKFLPEKVDRYFEPFLGSGAVFFYVIQKYKLKEVFLSDINDELITTYKMVRDDVHNLIIELRQHKEYHKLEGKKYYLSIRDVFPGDLKPLERAARFIYLNKTCFNGLYRVNSKGKFNVPMGSYKNPDIIQEKRLLFASELLQGVEIKKVSFENVLKYVKENDFVYLDPPYYPLNKGSFTTYDKNNFLDKEHEILKNFCDRLDKKGAFFLESNSDTEFIKNLYKKYKIDMIGARRLINSDSSKRGEVNELLIHNY